MSKELEELREDLRELQSDTEHRLRLLEDSHQLVTKLSDGLGSSADGSRIGLQESVRVITSSLETLTEAVSKLSVSVEKHEELVLRAQGAWKMAALLGTLCGLLGPAFSAIVSWASKLAGSMTQ